MARPSSPPLALLDSAGADASSRQRGKAPILELNAAAEAAGVRRGMTASQALARCSRLTFLQKNPAAETAAQDELLAHAARFTPDYENTSPGVVTLDVRACPQFRDTSTHGGFDPALQETFPHPVRLGIASAPDLAHLAAHLAAAPRFFCRIPPETKNARVFLAPLPLEVLRPLLDEVEIFHRLRQWGLRTLGHLAALPRNEIVRRLGPAGGTLWDYATGQNRRLLRLVHPLADYSRSFVFEHPIETAEPLLFILHQMLETLCARLASAWLVADAVRLQLDFENGCAHQRELHIAEPCADVELLFRLLQRHLDGFTAAAPVTRVHLDLCSARPGQHQKQLFEHSLRDPNRLAETLSHLETLLGKDRVGVPHLLPTRHLDGFLVRPFLDTFEKTFSAAPSKSSAPTQTGVCEKTRLRLPPLRRFRPARPARVTCVAGQPVELEAGDIRHVEGPWPLSGEWWDTTRHWAWQEWDIWLESGTYRLIQQEENWQLAGRYG